MHPIFAITFDAGGTLFRPHPSVGHIYSEVAWEEAKWKCDPEQLNQNFRNAWSAKQNFEHRPDQWSDLVRRTFQLDSPPPFFQTLYDRFADPRVWHLFPDVIPTLQRFRARKLRLAVLSNWDERLRPLLNSLGIEQYFETFIISHEVGFTKPHPNIFAAAVRRLGVPAESILHVGDETREDLEGAHRAGMQSLRIRRQGVERTGDIASLTEIRIPEEEVKFPHPSGIQQGDRLT